MSLIQVNDLTFHYPDGYENIFEHASFRIDTDWRLGMIGRNGRGKTTFLKLLTGEYTHSGTISASVTFDYFPFAVTQTQRETLAVLRSLIAPFDEWEAEMAQCLAKADEVSLARYGELLDEFTQRGGYTIDTRLRAEASKLNVAEESLTRPWATLSGGEQVKLLLAALFLRPNRFLLIDEPTNHLDLEGRLTVADYLSRKKGFLLVSHDRQLLDTAVDHVLSINRKTIEVQQGNYSTWLENRTRRDQFELAENEKLRKEITRLADASRRSAGWSDQLEKTKKGTRNSGLRPDRGFIGHKSAKMMQRSKSIAERREKAVEEKSGLLKDIEESQPLLIHPLSHPQQVLARAEGLCVSLGGRTLFSALSFSVRQGERIAVQGANGSGKTTLLRLFMGEDIPHTGTLWLAGGLKLSVVRQDTSFLQGSLDELAQERGIDDVLLRAILRRLDFSRTQFEKPLDALSGGQKKKVLLAASLAEQAHLYLWDEPLNFIDVLSRSQIEEVLLRGNPTLLFIEHDAVFCRNVATKTVHIGAADPE